MAIVPYTWVMRYVDVSAAAVLGETWPVFFILLMQVQFPGRPGDIPWRWLALLLGLSVVGLGRWW